MVCKKEKYSRYRAKDVGRKGHHYILLGIKGGKTKLVGGLRLYKNSRRK